ncbi:MAG: ABC transporter permease, partial [Clostridia bacterium]|nr:ABC transporter permease [Clostridia bacterium]
MNNTANITKEPLLRIVKRGSEGISAKKNIGIRAASVALALVIDAVFIVLVTGLNPLAVYLEIFKATFATPLRFKWAMRD